MTMQESTWSQPQTGKLSWFLSPFSKAEERENESEFPQPWAGTKRLRVWGGQELHSAPTSRDSQGENQQSTLQKHGLYTFCQAGQVTERVVLTAELAACDSHLSFRGNAKSVQSFS